MPLLPRNLPGLRLARLFSILYQRNIYPAEDFKMVKKYGLNMLVSTDDSLQSYLRKIMSQLNGAGCSPEASRKQR